MDIAPQRLVLVGLAAIVPAAVHAVSRGDLVSAIAVLNVFLIVGSLVVAMGSDAVPVGTPA